MRGNSEAYYPRNVDAEALFVSAVACKGTFSSLFWYINYMATSYLESYNSKILLNMAIFLIATCSTAQDSISQ